MYGYAKAYDDANYRGISSPGNYLWWLDAETGNTWSSSDLGSQPRRSWRA